MTESLKIVEERDASPAERKIKEINAGIYAFDLAPLFDALRSIAAQNAQGEFYLTDLVAIYRRRGLSRGDRRRRRPPTRFAASTAGRSLGRWEGSCGRRRTKS